MSLYDICSDGGEGSGSMVLCHIGHDCTDCGTRNIYPPPTSPPKSPPPLMPSPSPAPYMPSPQPPQSPPPICVYLSGVNKAHFDNWLSHNVNTVCETNNYYNIGCSRVNERYCVPHAFTQFVIPNSLTDKYYWCRDMNGVSTSMHITHITH